MCDNAVIAIIIAENRITLNTSTGPEQDFATYSKTQNTNMKTVICYEIEKNKFVQAKIGIIFTITITIAAYLLKWHAIKKNAER